MVEGDIIVQTTIVIDMTKNLKFEKTVLLGTAAMALFLLRDTETRVFRHIMTKIVFSTFSMMMRSASPSTPSSSSFYT